MFKAYRQSITVLDKLVTKMPANVQKKNKLPPRQRNVPSRSSNAPKFKSSRICRRWASGITCSWGDRCAFAHPNRKSKKTTKSFPNSPRTPRARKGVRARRKQASRPVLNCRPKGILSLFVYNFCFLVLNFVEHNRD